MDNIKLIVENRFNTKVVSLAPAGKGASGSVYCVYLKDEPFKIAVKVGDDFDMLKNEMEMLNFIKDKVDFKIPKPFFLCTEDNKSYLALEFIDGKSGKKIPLFCNKRKLSDNIISAFMNMQSVKNDKFGKYDNPIFDCWYDYYRDFFNKVYSFSKEKNKTKELEDVVLKALGVVDKNFNTVFGDISGKAVLCHGDFWLPNLMLDYKSGELKGVLDPFDMLWAEKEYELFCLTAWKNSKRLKLYENYKKKNSVSKYCDLKLEIYALCNELHWYEKLGTISHEYLIYRSVNILRLIKKI